MHLLTYTLLLLSAWGVLSYFSYQQIDQGLWWQALYRSHCQAQIQLQAQVQNEYFKAFKRPRMRADSSRRKSGSRTKILGLAHQESVEEDERLDERSKIKPDRGLSKPENVRFPVEKKIFFESSEKEFWQGAWKRLLCGLYGSEDFFLRAKRHDNELESNLLYQLLEAMEQLEREIPLEGRSSWDLSALDLQDPYLQDIWYKMIKGSDLMSSCYPSILRYVWFKDWMSAPEACELNIHFCEYPVLRALIGDEAASFFWQERQEIILSQIQKYQLEGKAEDYLLKDEFIKELLESRELNIPYPQLIKMISFNAGSTRRSVETLVLQLNDGSLHQNWSLLVR